MGLVPALVRKKTALARRTAGPDITTANPGRYSVIRWRSDTLLQLMQNRTRKASKVLLKIKSSIFLLFFSNPLGLD